MRETCLEYFRRRLREGWRCLSLEGYRAVLLSPDGNVRRELNLRNDTLTLVPNGAGDYTNIGGQYPSGTYHWQKVDDPVGSPDDDSTYVYTLSATQQKDAYALTNTSQTGTINSVRVYFRARSAYPGIKTAQPGLRLGTNEQMGTEVVLGTTYATYSEIISRPGGGDWSWADINNLQVIIGLLSYEATYGCRCTQVYIEVDYTPAGAKYTRTGSTAIGIAASASRVAEVTRSGACALGVLASATRVGEFSRVGTTALGILTSAWRGFDKVGACAIGIAVTASRSLEASRIGTAVVGLATSASRAFEGSRLGSTAIGVAATASRVLEAARTGITAVGVAVTASRLGEFTRVGTTAIGIATSAVMFFIRAPFRILGAVRNLRPFRTLPPER